MKIKSVSFNYLNFDNIDVMQTNGISCPDNSCSYFTVNGDFVLTDKARIFKFDSSFNLIWMLNFDDNHIAKNSIALHSSGSSLVIAMKSSSNCPLVKLDTTTNSIIEEIRIGSATDCDYLTLSSDHSNIYVSGKLSSTPRVFKIGYGDFSTTSVTSIPVSLNSVYSIHSYVSSGQELLTITGSVTSPAQAYSLLLVQYDTATQQWAKKIGCPTACVLAGTNDALVLESDNKVISYFLDTEPIIYVSNLDDGALVGSYVPDFTQTNLEISSIAYSTSFSKVFVLMKYNNGAYKIEYDPSTNSFSNSYVSTTIMPGWILEAGGHTLIGSGVPSSSSVIAMSRLASNGIYGQNTEVSFVSTSGTFISSTGYSYSDDATAFITTTPSSISKGFSSVSSLVLLPPADTNDLRGENEVIFQGEEYILDTTVNTTGNIAAFFPCSISGTTTITSVIDPHSNGEPKPAWVTVGTDSLSFDYTVPSSAGGQTFYFTGKSTVDGKVYLRNVQINVASVPVTPPTPVTPSPSSTNLPLNSSECDINYCRECSSSECTACIDGYTLTNNKACVKIEGVLSFNSSLIITGFTGTVVTSIVAGALSGSSSQNIWTLFNQFQLFMMIPFLRALLPFEFVQTLKALETSILNINLLDTRTLPIFKQLIQKIDYSHPYKEFRENEYESGSTLVSCFEILIYLVGATLLALILYPFLRMFCKSENKGCRSKIYIYFCNFFCFKFYLRYFMESFLFICIISVSEVSRILEATQHSISFSISVVIVFLLFLFMCLVPILLFKVKNPHESPYVRELFDGFKKQKLAQLYSFTFLLRRFIIVIVIVALRSSDLMTRLFVYLILQVLWLILGVIVRYHEEKCQNILEIINEVSYSTTILLTIALQKCDSGVVEVLLNNSILANTILVFLISIINLIYQIVLTCKSKMRGKTAISPAKTIIVKANQKLDITKRSPEIKNDHESSKNRTEENSQNISKDIEFSEEDTERSWRRIQVYPLFNKLKHIDPQPIPTPTTSYHNHIHQKSSFHPSFTTHTPRAPPSRKPHVAPKLSSMTLPGMMTPRSDYSSQS
ncbi:unnamed protein product [Moneuplotes crassus]|uniref:Uncharacterized protein n=1 Tax=Euplotes crassus TaxID=5936 RepID=A0AAD1Y752_EUPCR|nr:unnamed protein product [Moneuplotes crassus]